MGVKQGYSAWTHVLYLFFDRVWDYIVANTPPSCGAFTQYLALLETFIVLYADDVTLISASPDVSWKGITLSITIKVYKCELGPFENTWLDGPSMSKWPTGLVHIDNIIYYLPYLPPPFSRGL